MSSLPAYKRIAQDKENLKRLYREENYTLDEIGDEYGVGGNTISKAFDEAGLETRSQGGGSRGPSPSEQLAEERADELHRLYNKELLAGHEVADRIDETPDMVYRALEHAGIERQSKAGRIAEYFDLEQWYVDDHLSTYKIGDRLGVSNGVVIEALEKAGISLRPVGYQIENPTVNTPFEAGEAAYLAGLVDGEGHLKIKEGEYIKGGMQLKLWVKMGDEAAIRRLAEEFGGDVRHEPRDGDADMWKWNVARVLDIRLVLTAIRPFLRFKAELADDLLSHIEANYEEYLTNGTVSSEEVLETDEGGKTDLRYLAGILDGEGNIGVYKNGQGYKMPRIKVRMGAEDTVKWLQERFGGNFYHRPRDEENHSDMWDWITYSQSHVAEILQKVEPLMHVRDEAAREVLTFIESR